MKEVKADSVVVKHLLGDHFEVLFSFKNDAIPSSSLQEEALIRQLREKVLKAFQETLAPLSSRVISEGLQHMSTGQDGLKIAIRVQIAPLANKAAYHGLKEGVRVGLKLK